jgi:oxygen-independent coproporphyrinogen-3 oxidase
VNLDNLIEPFVQALIKEIGIVGKSKPGLQFHTVYFGGGTPSLLTAQQLQRILTAIRNEVDLLPGSEISMESNPSDLTAEYMASVRAVGINRLSIGMQSANEHELKLFERRHNLEAVIKAVEAARLGGFDNLNLDLIYGIPQQTLADWEHSLDVLLELKPEHVSLYALGLEDGTPLKTWVETGKYPAPDDDLAADMYDLATEKLGGAGLEQYEISNWAKAGLECRHNLQYWRNLPYPGVGPGAHGYADGVRYSTILSPQRYIKLMNEVGSDYEYPRTPVTDQATVVDRDSEISETLIMGLRLTQEGIRRDVFRERFGEDLLDVHHETIARYEKHGLLYVDQDVVRITQRGRLLSNMIFRDLV